MRTFKEFKESLSPTDPTNKSLEGPVYRGSWPDVMSRMGVGSHAPEDEVKVSGLGTMTREYAKKGAIGHAEEIVDMLRNDKINSRLMDEFNLLRDYLRAFLGVRGK